MCFTNAGIPVTLLEINEDALQRGKDIIARNFSISVKKGKLSEKDAVQRQEMISGTLDYNDLATGLSATACCGSMHNRHSFA